ncbi:hypothetical protein CC80DRAFT_546942 [Byssothecium circinans]|uniref:Uncharacterized protein n=1 Tax=Byssothecium circinans TaxID=147558 RepID=A0A6A5U9T8_9PLEO|nr:hypothetical protein CC80DRAFT_546942 [Byssothecium circinans]
MATQAEFQRLVEAWGNENTFVLANSKLKQNTPARYQSPVPVPAVPNLTGTVNSIFAKNKWPVANWAANTQLKILASQPMMSVLRRIRLGTLTTDLRTGLQSLSYTQPTTDAGIRTANAMVRLGLATLGEKLEFLWGVGIPSPNDQSQIHAQHILRLVNFGKDYWLDAAGMAASRNGTLNLDGSKRHYIVVNDAYRQYFSQPRPGSGVVTNRTHYRDYKTMFALAVLLVHDLSHAFYARNRTDSIGRHKEPYYDREESRISGSSEGELGFALERALFGVDINMVMQHTMGANFEVWPLDVLWTTKPARYEAVGLGKLGYLVYPMDPTWLVNFCQDAFWRPLIGHSAPPLSLRPLNTLRCPLTTDAVGRMEMTATAGEGWAWTKAGMGRGSLQMYMAARDQKLRQLLEELR